MKYVGENLCLILLCLAMCGCAATENRRALFTPASFNRMRRQTADINKVESKITIWDHMPWAASKNSERKKSASLVSQVRVSTDSPRSDCGDQNETTKHAAGQAVQHVNWEPRIDQADRAIISDRQTHIPESRLPTSSVWR